MGPRRLLYLTAHQLTACRWQAGALTEEESFDDSPGGLASFAEYLAQNPKSVFWLLANVSEEGFHLETIPFLRGADRAAIIARKLGQAFFSATLTTAISLGHEKSRRKDERIMLAALTNQELFAPWLSALASAEAALAGIYSLPLLAPLLLRKLGIADERCLLLTIQDQSVRQNYLEKGKLHFSRLTPLNQSSIAGMAQAFSSEAQKMHQYLVSQRLVARKQPITAYLVAHANARAAIESSCADSETLSFAVLDIETCARKCGVRTLPADTRCEPVFLDLLMANPPRAQFASDQQRHGYHLWLVRSALQGVGVVALLGCLLLSGKQLIDTYRLRQEIEGLSAETALARHRYDEVVKTFPPIPTTNENLRAVINRYTELEKSSVSPDYLYAEISRALQRATSVELESIEWRAGANLAPPVAGVTEAAPNPLLAVAQESAIVRATLRLGPESNPRQVLEVFNNLVEALKSNSQLEVDVLQQPFDVESGKSLKSGDTHAGERQPHSFKLRIRRVAAS